MNRVCLIAADERYPDDSPESISDLLSLEREQFAAVALPLKSDTERMLSAARRLNEEFGVAVIPVISEESLDDRPETVLEGVSALAKDGVLTADRRCPPAILIRPDGHSARAICRVSELREVLAPIGNVRFGWLNCVGTLTTTPAEFDFSVDWPPFVDYSSDVSKEILHSDALDLAIECARRHVNDGSLALSTIIGTSADGSFQLAHTKIVGLDAPIQQLWLDSARRFASNRFGFGVPFVFVRLLGGRKSSLPTWLPEILRKEQHSSWISPAPVQAVSLPKSRDDRPRIAVVIHLYYPDLWPEFSAAIEAMPEPADVYVSTPLLIADAVRARVLRDRPDAVVFGTRNIGRDVLPFLHVLRSVGTERYRYVLKLHSKKSMHMDGDGNTQGLGGGEVWRRRAIEELSGSPQGVSRLLSLMDADHRIGLVAPAGQLFKQDTWRCGTGNLVARLRKELGVRGEADTFPAGTMFWMRPAAIALLLSADPGLLDFEREAGQVDGTLHHAIERILAHVAVAAGYRLIDTSDTFIFGDGS